MILVLFLIFTALPIAEIYVLVQSSHAIGTWQTVGLVVVSGLIGTLMIRREARGLLAKVNSSLAQGNVPADELVSGLCLLVGGILMITPGFLTDVLGLLLVFPPTRHLMTFLLKAYLRHMIARGVVQFQYRTTQFGSARKPFEYEASRDVVDVDISSGALENSSGSKMRDLN